MASGPITGMILEDQGARPDVELLTRIAIIPHVTQHLPGTVFLPTQYILILYVISQLIQCRF